MAAGKYGVVTPFPKSPVMTAIFMAGGMHFFKEGTRKGITEVAERELYVRLPELSLPQGIAISANMSDQDFERYAHFTAVAEFDKGSSWIISCPEDHVTHTHDDRKTRPQVSKRRILFASDRGMSMEIFPVGKDKKPQGPMEVYEVEAGVISELQFDGKYAHRFVPNPGGKVIAYSVHPEDLSQDNSTLGVQTHRHELEIPDKKVFITVTAPELKPVMLEEALRGFDPKVILEELEKIGATLDRVRSDNWIEKVTAPDRPTSEVTGVATTAQKHPSKKRT